ncbi:MAG TPA: beta-propeller fold lactonase family protein [Candidatus Sulfotelmatobacter sp.]|nr:beta-propeller fold lactonase family protein [Candidatus Sulfotelmatobacter sp.]
MTLRLRILLILTVALGLLFWTSCSGQYKCSNTFSSNSCGSGGNGGGGIGGGGGGGGGGGAAPSAFAFTVDSFDGTMNSYTLSAGAGTFQATSNFTPLPIMSGDPGAGVVVAQKQFLYAVLAQKNLIYGWSISKTGTLTTLNGFPVTVSLSASIPVTTFRQVSVITNPAGTLLFISQPFFNQILIYQIGTTGALTAVPPFSTGTDSPMNLGMDGLGKYLYVTEDPNLITHTATKTGAYVVGTTGSLTAVPGSPFAVPMWQVQGDATGAFLIGISGSTTFYTGTPDDTNIYTFSIAQTGANAGAIAQVAKSPTTSAPFNLAVNPAAGFAYTFSINDQATINNPTEGFQLNATTGALTPAIGSPFGNLFLGGNGQFEQSGTYLFSHSGDVSTITSVQLSAFQAASTGALTQPFSNVLLPSSGYWAVTDPQ